MALHFSRVGPATGELEMWDASERGFSFVVLDFTGLALSHLGAPSVSTGHQAGRITL